MLCCRFSDQIQNFPDVDCFSFLLIFTFQISSRSRSRFKFRLNSSTFIFGKPTMYFRDILAFFDLVSANHFPFSLTLLRLNSLLVGVLNPLLYLGSFQHSGPVREEPAPPLYLDHNLAPLTLAIGRNVT